MISSVLHLLEWVIIIYFSISAWYIFFFSIAGLWGYHEQAENKISARKYAVLIPGYMEDAVIVDVAKEALNQEFPQEQFDVIVIADSFQQSTLDILRELPIQVVEVAFENSTKSKALNKAMEEIGFNYDVALILDADNVMSPHFIKKIDQAFQNGYHVVQGHRVAKNLNTNIAILDAVSEEINNHIFRRGHRVVGLSSAIIGSGMAFEYKLFKKMMMKIKAVGGFDKELELSLLRDGVKIEYIDEALVFDEKVQKKEVFEKQRTRWLSAQFVYFQRFVFSGFFHLVRKGNIDFFDKVYQMIIPPRILHLGAILILTGFYLLIHIFGLDPYFSFAFGNYFGLLLITIAAFVFAIPRKLFVKLTSDVLFEIPKMFMVMFKSLFNLRGANQKFIHTTHGMEEDQSEQPDQSSKDSNP